MKTDPKTATKAPVITGQARFPVRLEAGEYELRMLIMEFSPGAGIPEHVHGGHAITTLLDGELVRTRKGTPTTIGPGEFWTEVPGDRHAIASSGAAGARMVVTFLLPKGAEVTTPTGD